MLNIHYFRLFILLLLFTGMLTIQSCIVSYKLQDVSIPADVRTVKINMIENKATYINPALAPQLTDKLRQKILSQTKLSQTNNDDADWVINCIINNYSFRTSGISNQQGSTSQLSVGIKVTVSGAKKEKPEEQSVSRNFEFSASQSIQQAEAALQDEMLRGLTDDIFNRIFSNW